MAKDENDRAASDADVLIGLAGVALLGYVVIKRPDLLEGLGRVLGSLSQRPPAPAAPKQLQPRERRRVLH